MYNQPATLDVLECSNINNTFTVQPYNKKVSLSPVFLDSDSESLNDEVKDSLKSDWKFLNDQVKDEYYHTLNKVKENLTDDTYNTTPGYILVGIFSVIMAILLYFHYTR